MIRYNCTQHRLINAIGKPCQCFNRVDLRKWPRIVVVGDRVTNVQAAEIIIRTELWSYCPLFDVSHPNIVSNTTNSTMSEWQDDVRAVLAKYNIELAEQYSCWNVCDKDCRAMLKTIQHIPLEHIHNNRVASGNTRTSGWCDWNGTIFLNCTVGKWPDLSEIVEEWDVVAQTFPYLTATCQLFNEDPDDGDHLLATIKIAGGNVEVSVGQDVGDVVVIPTDFKVSSISDYFVWADGQYCDPSDFDLGIRAAINGRPCPVAGYMESYGY